MTTAGNKTKLKQRKKSFSEKKSSAETLNGFPSETFDSVSNNVHLQTNNSNVCSAYETYLSDTEETEADKDAQEKYLGALDSIERKVKKQSEADKKYREAIKKAQEELFVNWNEEEFKPNDYEVNVAVNSLESKVGYSSLVRELHDSFAGTVAFYRSSEGGSLTEEEAREKAFHKAPNPEQAKEIFNRVMSYASHDVNFSDLHSLFGFAPRVAEHLWEEIKKEGRAEFESGHLAANRMHPVKHMKQAWDVARYLGVRKSFVAEWQLKGGIEISMIDMLAQSYFQFQYWTEQTIKRSQTAPREEHYEYQKWKQRQEELTNAKSWNEGYWFPPYVSEQQAVEHAVQMADRWNRIFMRTLRQLRDLRRYSPVTINNPNQVNIAANGGQQVNLSNPKVSSKLIDENKKLKR